MDNTTITILFFLLAFVSEIIGTLSGFGSSVFFVPLAGMLFDFKTTLALTGILHIFSTSAQVYMFRKKIYWFMAIGTFSDKGPKKCSMLNVHQYTEEELQKQLHNGFEKIKCVTEDHITPFHTTQNFLFCSFKRAIIN